MSEADPGAAGDGLSPENHRPEGPPLERREQAHRLANELRRIIEKLVLVDAPAEDLARAADAAAAFADRLTGLPSRRWYEGFSEAANAGSPSAFFDHSPFIGLANPLAAPIRLEVATEADGSRVVRGTGVFGAAYEGPPGCVHGGFVAASFDEVLGFAQSLSGKPGMTGTLTIKYRKPTPLFKELTFEARVDRIDGRKIFTVGTCSVDGQLCAEAEAIFVTVDFERIAQMMTERSS